MRKGGGKDKGSSFERLIAAQLSGWLTRGRRNDLFSRNVLSGGQFTVARKKKEKKGTPGDLVGIDPLAANFLSVFFVECKHYKSLGIEAFFFDNKCNSFLAKVIKHCTEQAIDAKLSWMIVARQNMRPTLLIVPIFVGRKIGTMAKKDLGMHYSFRGVSFFLWERVISSVSISSLIEYMKEAENDPNS